MYKPEIALFIFFHNFSMCGGWRCRSSHIYETHFIQDVKWGQGRRVFWRNISTSFLMYEPCTFRQVIFPLIHNASAINIQCHIRSVIVVSESGSSLAWVQATVTRTRRKCFEKSYISYLNGVKVSRQKPHVTSLKTTSLSLFTCDVHISMW